MQRARHGHDGASPLNSWLDGRWTERDDVAFAKSPCDPPGLGVRRSHFPGCAVHCEEAAAVYTTVESLNGGRIGSDDPDIPLAQLVPEMARRALSQGDSLDVIENQMALEAELASSELTSLALAELADESVVKPLLGSAWGRSRWDPGTIWSRSLRGVVNERVRYRGGCSCG
jgi:hypothetical protein